MNLIWGNMQRGMDYDTAEYYAELEEAGVLCGCDEGQDALGLPRIGS